jgi:hypothetical protein
MVAPFYGSDFLVIEDPKAAEFLTSPESSRFLRPFFLRERSAAEAAEVLKVNVDTMLYRIKSMLEFGLIEQTSVEARRGRPIKRYKTTSQHYAVPFGSTKADTIVDLMRGQVSADTTHLLRGLAAATAGPGGGWVFRIYLQGRTLLEEVWPDDELEWSPAELLKPGAPADHGIHNVRLKFQEAKALQLELAQLLEKYQALHGRPHEAGEKYYTLQLGLAEIVESNEEA